MLHKLILFLLTLMVIFCECKKTNAPVISKNTIFSKMAGKRTWNGIAQIGHYPYHYMDTTYSISFSDTIYVYKDSTVTYSDVFDGRTNADTLLYEGSLNNLELLFNAAKHYGGNYMYYYYLNDSITWHKWYYENDKIYEIKVHSP